MSHNPPVFPQDAIPGVQVHGPNGVYHTSGTLAHPGMTLRDYFAGQALAGLCANRDYLDLLPKFGGPTEIALAQVSYNVADAMLTARNEGQPK